MTTRGSPQTVFRRLSSGPDASAAAVTAALQQLYGFFVEHYDEILAMPGSFASVRRGLALAAEPPELINTVLSKLADRINQARTAAELAERVGAYCRLGYVYRAMENENNDYGRRQRRLRPLSDRTGSLDAERPAAGERTGVTMRTAAISRSCVQTRSAIGRSGPLRGPPASPPSMSGAGRQWSPDTEPRPASPES